MSATIVFKQKKMLFTLIRTWNRKQTTETAYTHAFRFSSDIWIYSSHSTESHIRKHWFSISVIQRKSLSYFFFSFLIFFPPEFQKLHWKPALFFRSVKGLRFLWTVMAWRGMAPSILGCWNPSFLMPVHSPVKTDSIH